MHHRMRYVQHFTLATIPASNATNVRLKKVRETDVQIVRSAEVECLST
jgi:hypothetical protein